MRIELTQERRVKLRTLGDGLRVSALGLGCMPMVGTGFVHYGAASDAESIATIHRAVDLELLAAELARLDAAAPLGATAGPRYGALYMRMVDR